MQSAKGKGVRREVESEGSRRRSSNLMNKNRIQGGLGADEFAYQNEVQHCPNPIQ